MERLRYSVSGIWTLDLKPGCHANQMKNSLSAVRVVARVEALSNSVPIAPPAEVSHFLEAYRLLTIERLEVAATGIDLEARKGFPDGIERRLAFCLSPLFDGGCIAA